MGNPVKPARLFTSVNVTGQTPKVEIDDLSDVTLFVTGTFVSSLQPQISHDNGTTWLDEGAAITTPGAVEISKSTAAVRLNVTFTSGVAVAAILGR